VRSPSPSALSPSIFRSRFLLAPIGLSFSQRGASARKVFDSCFSFRGSPARGFITMRLYYQDFKTRSIGLPFNSLELSALICRAEKEKDTAVWGRGVVDLTEESIRQFRRIIRNVYPTIKRALCISLDLRRERRRRTSNIDCLARQ